MTGNLLWIEDSSIQGPVLETLNGFRWQLARGAAEALEHIRASSFDAVVANFPLADWTAEEFLEDAQRANGLLPVVIRSLDAKLADAVRLVKLGAFQYVAADTEAEALIALLESAVEYRRNRELALFPETPGGESWKKFLVGESQAIQKVGRLVSLVGNRRCTVLISGETGTGKEMAARAIHAASSRAHLPMVAVNCSALPENLLEAELFGHVRGAFTGAINQRVGRFEQAHRSTLFLDEIGDMPVDTQAKLLRVLQEREFERIGSSESIQVDVRVIAASNVNLAERVRQGRFREDLYYRLNVVPVEIPPLRERLRDIPLLVHHFLEKICRQEGLPIKVAAPETMERLSAYSWPGNVRQLENAVEMGIALSADRPVLYPSDLSLTSAATHRPLRTDAPVVAVPDDGLDFEQTVGRIELAILEQALRKTGGNKKQAAEMLHLKRTTLSAKLRSLAAAGGDPS